MAQRVCSRMVDLPMPGSPPISTTEPSTRPPPSTRSSSPEAVEKRGTSSTLTSARVLICACCPAPPPRPDGAAAPPLSIRVSVRAFQAPHSPHCAAHLGKVAPHSVQPYMRLALAMEVSSGKTAIIAPPPPRVSVMQIELVPTTAEQRSLIANLYQYYAYESSDWEEE